MHSLLNTAIKHQVLQQRIQNVKKPCTDRGLTGLTGWLRVRLKEGQMARIVL